MIPEKLQNNPQLFEQVVFPEKHGIHPIKPGSPVSKGRHVLGRTDSVYISASTRPLGSPRFKEKRYWINLDKVRASGATIHENTAIIKNLQRIAQKSKDSAFLDYLKDILRKSKLIDKEVLIEGSIPATAIKGAFAKGLTTSLQFVGAYGVVVSLSDLAHASTESYKQQKIQPIATESIKQAGRWGAAFMGARIGASVGGLFGIETGPGAVLTAAAGGMIFGMAGYIGADWLAKYIYSSE